MSHVLFDTTVTSIVVSYQAVTSFSVVHIKML